MAELPTNLTAVVLRRLIIAATDCHHDGVAHSARLAVCLRSASIALRLDPRWADTELHTIPNPIRHGRTNCLPRPTTARATRPASCRA